jgi:hypothetical protein
MPTQTSVHFFHNWAKERIDEMDAIVLSLKRKAADLQVESRVKADQFISDLRKTRDEFEVTVKKQAKMGEAAWETIKLQLEAEWKGFETQVEKYFETFGKDIKQYQDVFESQVTAQMKAWHDAANQIQAAASEFAAARRKDIDATISRMRADAATADERLQKLARAGAESWPALSAALTETRGVFDRVNQDAREAFKRATEPMH